MDYGVDGPVSLPTSYGVDGGIIDCMMIVRSTDYAESRSQTVAQKIAAASDESLVLDTSLWRNGEGSALRPGRLGSGPMFAVKMWGVGTP